MVLYQSSGNATIDEYAVVSGAATPELVTEWAVLLCLVFLITGLRTYARAKVSGWRGLSWDDYLVWVAVLFYTCLSANVYVIGVVGGGLASDGIPDDHRAALAQNPDGQEYKLRQFGAVAQLVKLLLYALVLWTLKASLLYCFAIRLTGDIPGARARTWTSVGLLVATFLGSLAAMLTSCRPFPDMWRLYPDAGVMCQANISPLIIMVFLACNILSDLYLVSMPIPVLLRAPLKKTQKASLISLFSCNMLITVMAIVRAVFIIKDPWANGDGMWEIRETFVALITTCVPPLAPLLRRWLCLGRDAKLTTAQRVEAAKQRSSKPPPGSSHGAPRRSPSKATLRAVAQMQHNEAMRDRYLSGFAGSGTSSQDRLASYDTRDLPSRANSDASTASSSASSTDPPLPGTPRAAAADKMASHETRSLHSRATSEAPRIPSFYATHDLHSRSRVEGAGDEVIRVAMRQDPRGPPGHASSLYGGGASRASRSHDVGDDDDAAPHAVHEIV